MPSPSNDAALDRWEAGAKIAYAWARYVDEHYRRGLSRHERIAFRKLLADFESPAIESACSWLDADAKERLCDLHAELQEYVLPGWEHGDSKAMAHGGTPHAEELATTKLWLADRTSELLSVLHEHRAVVMKLGDLEMQIRAFGSVRASLEEHHQAAIRSRREIARLIKKVASLTIQNEDLRQKRAEVKTAGRTARRWNGEGQQPWLPPLPYHELLASADKALLPAWAEKYAAVPRMPHLGRLVKLCIAIDKQAGGEPWPLTVERLMGMLQTSRNKTQAMLQTLRADGVLTRILKGTRFDGGRRKASTWRLSPLTSAKCIGVPESRRTVR